MSFAANYQDTKSKPVFYDVWSWAHFTFGVFAAWGLDIAFPQASVGSKFVLWLILHTMYEIKDYYYCYLEPDAPGEYTGARINSLLNSVGDTIWATLGFFVYYWTKSMFYSNEEENKNKCEEHKNSDCCIC